MLFPIHIATRGRCDGEYGIATRGYVICPDIVPRFPSDADVRPEFVIGEVRELGLRAELHRSVELTGLVAEKADFEATIAEVMELFGDVDSPELQARVRALSLSGAIDPRRLAAAIRDHDVLAEVRELGLEGILRLLDLLGATSDEPPHC